MKRYIIVAVGAGVLDNNITFQSLTKRQLEDFELEWGSYVYAGPWERKAQELADKTKEAYQAYKKAWVEWYAASNGYSLSGSPGRQKDTPVFAAPVPTRFLLRKIKVSNQ